MKAILLATLLLFSFASHGQELKFQQFMDIGLSSTENAMEILMSDSWIFISGEKVNLEDDIDATLKLANSFFFTPEFKNKFTFTAQGNDGLYMYVYRKGDEVVRLYFYRIINLLTKEVNDKYPMWVEYMSNNRFVKGNIEFIKRAGYTLTYADGCCMNYVSENKKWDIKINQEKNTGIITYEIDQMWKYMPK